MRTSLFFFVVTSESDFLLYSLCFQRHRQPMEIEVFGLHFRRERASSRLCVTRHAGFGSGYVSHVMSLPGGTPCEFHKFST